MTKSNFPILENLMQCYFNQDYDMYGETDEEILRLFVHETSTLGKLLIVAEIDRLLAEPVAGLYGRFVQETGEWNIEIGETDVETQEWLRMAREVIVSEQNTVKS